MHGDLPEAHVDGCDLDFTVDAADDETALVTSMFADVPEDQLEELAEYYRAGWDEDA